MRPAPAPERPWRSGCPAAAAPARCRRPCCCWKSAACSSPPSSSSERDRPRSPRCWSRSGGPHDLKRVPCVPLPAPRIMSLKPAQGKLCPLGARGRRLKSRRDVACLAHDFLQIRARSEHCSSRRRTFAFSPSRCLLRSSMRRRWCERSASSSASSQGRLVEGCWPSEQLQGRIVRPRSGLFLKPCLHAA